MTPAEQVRFDAIIERVVRELPPHIRAVIDELPVTVVDRPDQATIDALIADGIISPEERDDPEALLGLHTGVAITDRGIDESGMLPGVIHVFREAILAIACDDEGWNAPDADERIYAEVRITLLHEIGHHFGLDEDDLDALGYA